MDRIPLATATPNLDGRRPAPVDEAVPPNRAADGGPAARDSAAAPRPARRTDEATLDVRETTCCIVGGGPAGAVLALLLARRGVEVALLEAHGDFEREFRGDSLHPSVLEIMDQLGLTERLHALPHSKVYGIPIEGEDGPVLDVDLRRLRSTFPYIMLTPQARFLELVTEEAARYPNFRLVMGANVRHLLEDRGRVRGVRYRSRDGWHDVRAELTIGADGRHSMVRKLANIRLVAQPVPFDGLWFRLPRRPGDPDASFGRLRRGRLFAALRRTDHWQTEATIEKGSFDRVRATGLPALRRTIAEALPELAEHLDSLQEWRQITLLSVEAGRVARWHRPGLLLIGDAAHIMSPAVGAGINYAIQDAVVAGNVLARPLLTRQRGGPPVPERRLAEVQCRRELPTRFILALQGVAHRFEDPRRADRPPVSRTGRRIMRLPIVRDILAHVVGIGLWRVRVRGARMIRG